MGIRQVLRSGGTPVLGTLIPLLALGTAPNASAQVFCPAQNNLVLNGSFCTNGTIGALSTAALSSQSLSEVTEATTQQSTSSALQALDKRRNEERTRDTTPARTAEPSRTTPARSSSPGSSQSTMTEPSRGVRREARETVRREPIYKAPPMIYEPVRYAVWGQGFGEYERRTGSGVVPPPALGGLGLLGPTPINMSQSVTTWGFNGGADATFRNNWWLGDILIAGILTGYMSSDVRFSTGTLTARVEGPSLGGYVTYLSGPWTTELLGRVDFLRLSESFSETLNFGGATGAVPISGSGATNLNDYIAAGNVYYKLIDARAWWLEPTAGFRFTQSSYDSSAAALGLASGHVWRVQGGMRLAGNYYWGGVLVTPTITGLAYEDVQVTGQVVTAGQFNASPIIPLDQGKVRGQGILALNFDYGNGVSTFVSGEVHGGSNLFGAGGKAGVRYQW
jgi:Autotransporter beta-domain